MTIATDISTLGHIHANTDLAKSYGMAINTVTWEDTSRTKGSCWGPNISDLTLVVTENERNISMNMIRKPNFSDITADMPCELFTVPVGNNNGGELKRIPIKEYVENLGKYNKIKGEFTGNLWDDRDKELLISAQCCVLPSTENGETEFCPRMYNYQSAVLVIVSTSQGTSSMIMSGVENLYFNKNGRKVKYLAKRLKKDREERGVALEGEMTNDEEDRNAIEIYQIPLKRKEIRRMEGSFGTMDCNSGGSFTFSSGSLTTAGGIGVSKTMSFADVKCSSVNNSFSSMKLCGAPRMSRSAVIPRQGMDDAMLRVSEKDLGEYPSLDASRLVRDTQYPIRVTYQFYKVSDTAHLKEDDVIYMANKISGIYDVAKAKGSLVVSDSNRTTETRETAKPKNKFQRPSIVRDRDSNLERSRETVNFLF